MLKCSIAFGPVLAAYLLWQTGTQTAHENGSDRNAYGMKLPVDEVVVTFHVSDAHGLPINDLKESEIGLLDNGKPPGRILAFDEISGRPLRAGILIDTSDSMFNDFPRIRSIATEYSQNLFRQQSDKAFVMDFAFSSSFVQPWTSDPSTLLRSAQSVKPGMNNQDLPGGTALFDAIFRACQYGFNSIDPSASGNFIVLFTDGQDNAGLTTPEEALNACQSGNIAIYAFRSHSSEGTNPLGTAVLNELTSKSGGRLFTAEGDLQSVFDNLKVIESDLRNQYRIVYRPSNLKHDGAFHEIVLRTPDRATTIQVRTGYYAPVQ